MLMFSVLPPSCLQMKCISYWFLIARISDLQLTLDGLHHHSLLPYRLCMRMFLDGATCLSYQALIDIFGDYALLSSQQEPASAGFQQCHRVFQETLGLLVRHARILHMVEPSCLSGDEALATSRASGLTETRSHPLRLVVIIIDASISSACSRSVMVSMMLSLPRSL